MSLLEIVATPLKMLF